MNQMDLLDLHINIVENKPGNGWEERKENIDKNQQLFKKLGIYHGEKDANVRIFTYYLNKNEQNLRQDFSDIMDDMKKLKEQRKFALRLVIQALTIDIIMALSMTVVIYSASFKACRSYAFVTWLLFMGAFALGYFVVRYWKNRRRELDSVISVERAHLGFMILAMADHKSMEKGKDMDLSELESLLSNDLRHEFLSFKRRCDS